MLKKIASRNPPHDRAKNMVSVIMPMFNHEKYVAAAIESIKAQTYKNWELIIVDDGSTDGSAMVAKNHAKQNKKIKYYYQHNMGEHGARNAGLKLARGGYIAWLDADDIAHPKKLQTQVAHLEKNQDTAVCGVQCERIDAQGQLIDKPAVGRLHVPYRNGNGKSRNPLTDISNDIVGATIMVRKTCYDKVGYYRAVDVGTDYDMLLRMEEHFKMVNLPDYLYGWRLHGDASIARVKKNGYHGRLGISLNRLVVNLSCLARRFYGRDPLMPLVGRGHYDVFWPLSPRPIPLARPRVFFLFWQTPRLWRYVPRILRINKMSVPEFLARLLWAWVATRFTCKSFKSLKE